MLGSQEAARAGRAGKGRPGCGGRPGCCLAARGAGAGANWQSQPDTSLFPVSSRVLERVTEEYATSEGEKASQEERNSPGWWPARVGVLGSPPGLCLLSGQQRGW